MTSVLVTQRQSRQSERRIRAESDREAIREAYVSGELLRDIAQRYGVHTEVVSPLLEGLRPEDATARARKDVKHARRLAEQGVSMAKIAERYGCGPDSIRRILNEAERASRTGSPKSDPTRPLPSIAEVVRVYRVMPSVRQVGIHFGCSDKAVRARLIAAGEPFAKPGKTLRRGGGGARGDRVLVAHRRLGTVAEAAKLVGVPETTARGWLKARGVDTSDKWRRTLSRAHIASICAAYDGGDGLRPIAAREQVNPESVRRLLIAEGVPLRPFASPRNNNQPEGAA